MLTHELKPEDYDKIPEELKLKAMKFFMSTIYVVSSEEAATQGKIKTAITPKKIDISVFVGSGLDMEFGGLEHTAIGKLVCIHPGDDVIYAAENKGMWTKCRPRLNHIYACPNRFDKCPLPEGLRVKLYHRDGNEVIVESIIGVNWYHNGECDDIIAFEIISLADGWEW